VRGNLKEPPFSPSPAPREREEPGPNGREGEDRTAESYYPSLESPGSFALATLSRGAGEGLAR